MSEPKPTIERVIVQYSQQEDTSGRGGIDYQQLEIEMVRMEEGDEGFYVVMKTDRWAINDAAEFSALIEDFAKRCKNP